MVVSFCATLRSFYYKYHFRNNTQDLKRNYFDVLFYKCYPVLCCNVVRKDPKKEVVKRSLYGHCTVVGTKLDVSVFFFNFMNGFIKMNIYPIQNID